MARGLEQHQARVAARSLLGKNLTRRSGASCELCDASGVALSVFEVPPLPAEPSEAHAAFLCLTCTEQIEKPRRRDPDHWRCLHRSVWSEVPAVQALAVYMLGQFQQHDWAVDLQEMLYLQPEVQAWTDSLQREMR